VRGVDLSHPEIPNPIPMVGEPKFKLPGHVPCPKNTLIKKTVAPVVKVRGNAGERRSPTSYF